MANILLVDDEPLVVETLSNAMASQGHRVVTAANGNDGMEKFVREKFDLVITDIIMPDKEGIEFMLEMRRHSPEIKIVAISGGGRTTGLEFLTMATRLGATASIAKPIRLAEFRALLDKYLGENAAPAGSSGRVRMP